MKVEFDYKEGQSIYLKNDREQQEYLLHRLIFDIKKKEIILELFSPLGDVIEARECYCSIKEDILKKVAD